jgi:hypothetical protein
VIQTRAGLAASVISAALVTFGSRDVRADEKGREGCFAASEQAQLLRNDGRLRRAREAMRICAGESCPSQMRRDCAKWLGEVEATLATVVIDARDAGGRELTEVRVSLDGEAFVDRLDGRPVEVDPGDHVFRFTTEDGRTREARQIIHAGDRLVRIDVVFDAAPPPVASAPTLAAPPAPPPPTVPVITPSSRRTRSSPPVAAYAFGALALTTGGVGAVLAVTGLYRQSNLGATCFPRCPVSEVDSLHSQYVAADILNGVALVSAGIAIWFFVARRSSPPKESALRLVPAVGPGGIGLKGLF